jgi:hypothetical protein
VPGRLNALIGKLTGEKKEGEKAGRGGIRAAAAAGRRGRGRRKGREGKERLTGGARASATAKEKKRREGEAGRRGMASWAGRPGWAERGAGHGFVFFKTSFSNHFSFEIQIKTPSNLFSKIYKLFRNHTNNQKPCKPTDDAQTLVVSKFIKLCLIF